MKRSEKTNHQQTIILPDDGESFAFGEVGGLFKIRGEHTDGQFSVGQLSEIPPRTLAAPLHRHHNEDEYTYVVEGTLGTMTGEKVITAEPGTWLIKPKGQWHTFWNAGDTPCHMIEIVSPAGFENYFNEVAEAGGDPEKLMESNQKYSIDMDMESIPKLCERFGLRFQGPE